MLPATRTLLLTDLDGEPVDEVEDVITAAFDEPEYLDRVPSLEALLADSDTPAADRFIVVSALASWSTRAGLSAVQAAALDPDHSPFRGATADRRYSVDDTFTYFAESVGMGDEFIERFQTGDLRHATAKALVRLAASEFYDWQLAYLVNQVGVATVQEEIDATIREGIVGLRLGDLSFPLGPQLADLAVSVVKVDEAQAVSFAYEIASTDSSLETAQHLVRIVSAGSTIASAEFGDYLRTQAGEEIGDALGLAWKSRIGRVAQA
jgi:predicted Zn-dependent protease